MDRRDFLKTTSAVIAGSTLTRGRLAGNSVPAAPNARGRGPQLVDQDRRTVGFREAQFTDHGFELNGKVIKLRGLDRHQTFSAREVV